MGLFKRCEHKGRNRDRCEDPWWGSFRGHRVSLAKWADQDVTTKEEAQGVLDQFRNTVRGAMRAGLQGTALKASLAAGLKAQQAKGQPLTFKDFADLYLERYVQMNGLKSEDTITYRMTALKAHFGDRALSDIRTADIEDFLASLRQPAKLGVHHKAARIRRPATINRYRSQLVQMFNWAVARDYLDRSPCEKGGQTLIPAIHEDNKRDRRLSASEETRLMLHADPPRPSSGGKANNRPRNAERRSPLKLLITAALFSGMRRGEMLALTWADLAARPGWIRLRGVTAKSRKTRYLPVHPNVQAVFDFLRTDANGDEKPADGPVFSNEVGEPIRCFRTAWERALKRAGITNFHWHDLRHEFASRLTESGVPLVQVQELLGHASIVTTERYNTNKAERLQAAMQSLPATHTPVAEQATDDPNKRASDAATAVSQSLHTDGHAATDPASRLQIS